MKMQNKIKNHIQMQRSYYMIHTINVYNTAINNFVESIQNKK